MSNPETYRQENLKKEPIHYGDAGHRAVLQNADIKDARCMVVVINDPAAARRITETARKLNPKLYIIVRTRYLQEMQPLLKLGASEVIPEEFETSVEIFTRVLRNYLVPKNEIEKLVIEVRSDGYEMLRGLSHEATSCSDIQVCLPEADVVTYRIDPGAPIAGKTLADIALRKKHGVTLLAINRGGEMLFNLDAESRIISGDTVMVIGPRNKLSDSAFLFQSPSTAVEKKL